MAAASVVGRAQVNGLAVGTGGDRARQVLEKKSSYRFQSVKGTFQPFLEISENLIKDGHYVDTERLTLSEYSINVRSFVKRMY